MRWSFLTKNPKVLNYLYLGIAVSADLTETYTKKMLTLTLVPIYFAT